MMDKLDDKNGAINDSIEIVSDDDLYASDHEIQTNDHPEDPNVLIQEKDKEFQSMMAEPKVESPNILADSIAPGDKATIAYLDQLENGVYNPVLKQNLVNLMNMGFVDFNRNIELLEKNHNSLELTCSQMF
jgi:hypothetical protein